MLSAKEITDISDDDDFKTEDPTLAHLLAGAILVHIADNVNVDDRAGEISNKTFGMFKELQIQKAGLLSAYSGEAEGKFGYACTEYFTSTLAKKNGLSRIASENQYWCWILPMTVNGGDAKLVMATSLQKMRIPFPITEGKGSTLPAYGTPPTLFHPDRHVVDPSFTGSSLPIKDGITIVKSSSKTVINGLINVFRGPYRIYCGPDSPELRLNASINTWIQKGRCAFAYRAEDRDIRPMPALGSHAAMTHTPRHLRRACELAAHARAHHATFVHDARLGKDTGSGPPDGFSGRIGRPTRTPTRRPQAAHATPHARLAARARDTRRLTPTSRATSTALRHTAPRRDDT
ncbi:hypothetical protein GGX14DRAFT_562518 [Mycena pura]|uniref:Uncharacterized protein n=1 Tax=Mycena pura TaxID=153505 RepID=A0AAD6VM08_9AGAR|nr:hypothetical protein GGX14DRAFT_562518 [Mycena pura]